MTTMALKVPDVLVRKIVLAAERQHTTRSALIRLAVEKYIDEDLPDRAQVSAYDLVKCVAGTVQGPRDLSSNERHLCDSSVGNAS